MLSRSISLLPIKRNHIERLDLRRFHSATHMPRMIDPCLVLASSQQQNRPGPHATSPCTAAAPSLQDTRFSSLYLLSHIGRCQWLWRSFNDKMFLDPLDGSVIETVGLSFISETIIRFSSSSLLIIISTGCWDPSPLLTFIFGSIEAKQSRRVSCLAVLAGSLINLDTGCDSSVRSLSSDHAHSSTTWWFTFAELSRSISKNALSSKLSSIGQEEHNKHLNLTRETTLRERRITKTIITKRRIKFLCHSDLEKPYPNWPRKRRPFAYEIGKYRNVVRKFILEGKLMERFGRIFAEEISHHTYGCIIFVYYEFTVHNFLP